MEKPNLSDFTTGACMNAPYGVTDETAYIKALEKYVLFLEGKPDIKSIAHIFYTEDNKVYLIHHHKSHSLAVIENAIEYAKEIGCTIPDKNDIKVEVLKGRRFYGVLSVEFQSETTPKCGTLLTKDSGLWECLTY